MVYYNYAAQQLIADPPTIKEWLYAIAFVSHWNPQAYQQLKARFMALFPHVQNDAQFHLLMSLHVPHDYYPRWVDSTDFPYPPDNLVTDNIERKVQQVDDDIDAIRMAYSNDLLGILISFPEDEVGKDFSKELYVPFPPYEDETFRIHVSNILNSVLESKYSYLVHEFHALAFWETTSSHCLYRDFAAFHTSTSSLYRLHRNGDLVPVEMDREILDRYCIRGIPWDTTVMDKFGPAYNGILAMYQGATFNPLEPPPHHLRNTPAYHSLMVNKSRCPSPAGMRARMGQLRYNVMDRHFINQLGYPGGADPHFEEYVGCIMVFPGNDVDDSAFLTHPHHFEKQARKADLSTGRGQAGLWTRIKDRYDGLLDQIFRRARRMMRRALEIRTFLQSAGYAERSARESDCGQHAYATSNIIRAKRFHLCNSDRRHLHLPGGDDQEYGKSFWIQVLASDKLRLVHAIGMDYQARGHEHLIKWDVPIPVIFSYHVSNGPVAHPILGSIVTSNETWYRPTLRPFKFRYAIRSRSNRD